MLLGRGVLLVDRAGDEGFFGLFRGFIGVFLWEIYYDLQTLVVMFVVTRDQVIDVRTIAGNALAGDFYGFQMEHLPKFIQNIQ